ncbi:LPS assembly lipoprotein LptE [Cesiribacter andamanensis]|uniref:Lipopolysaccharide-assembly n=1 Tax=Cesiribacter andamanensis AMV16 TaxID=1279009 RepID=M7NKW0_9BACT|nr:LptE family protein [Cesiribacter andamanensis]EMR02430.1 hypothetical protein ADICEAN_02416 [Cesiribacter andamanensis AMV16]
MKLKSSARIQLLLMGILLSLQGCGFYSFTGTNLSPTIRTITIQPFVNESGGGPPTLSQTFTEGLRDFYQRNTNLTITPNDGDLLVEGMIVGWDLAPVAPTASGTDERGDLAGQQRLTIAVRVIFVNTQDESASFERNFSYWADYNPNQTDLQSAEPRLIDEIFERIIFDVFNATVANW